jgi:hypothetical protein
MTARLRDAFEDLAATAPRPAGTPDRARRAWRAGRRRRWGKRMVGSLAVVALVVLAAITFLPLADQVRSLEPAEGHTGVTGYPQRVGHQWWVRDLPDRPGPVAGLVQLKPSREATSHLRGWYAISQSGHRWRVPADHDFADERPTLSPTGRYLGYVADSSLTYVIRDLVTGEVVEFADIGGGRPTPTPRRYGDSGQTPSFWSPGGDRVLMRAGDLADDGMAVWLLLGVDGSMSVVPIEGTEDEWLGHLAGWAGHDAVHLVNWTPEDPGDWASPAAEVVVRTVSLDGEVLRTLSLRPDTTWRETFFSQWSAVSAPDGGQLLVIEDPGEHARLFSLATGAELATPRYVGSYPVCGPGWGGTTPHVPADDARGNATTVAVDTDQPRPLVVADPLLGTSCFVWAADALAGTPRGGLFGLWDPWWTWWWREAVLLLGVAGAGILVVRWRRRRATGVTPN